MKLPHKLIIPIIGLTFLATPVSADFDLTGLNQQVQNIGARTTNNEKDIKALQDATNTAPAADDVEVPAVTETPINDTQTVTGVSQTSDSVIPPSPSPVVPATTKTIMTSNMTGTVGSEEDPPMCHYTFDDGSSSDETARSISPTLVSCKMVGTQVPLS